MSIKNMQLFPQEANLRLYTITVDFKPNKKQCFIFRSLKKIGRMTDKQLCGKVRPAL